MTIQHETKIDKRTLWGKALIDKIKKMTDFEMDYASVDYDIDKRLTPLRIKDIINFRKYAESDYINN